MPASQEETGEVERRRGTRSRKGTCRTRVDIRLDDEQRDYCKQIAEAAGYTTLAEGIRQIIAEHRAGSPEVERLKAELMRDEAFRMEVAGDVLRKFLDAISNGVKSLTQSKKPKKGERKNEPVSSDLR